MSLTELNDRNLVKQFQKGNGAAFECFIRRHQDRLMRIALVSLYASKDAEDAVRETFLIAYSGLSSFRFSAEPFTWLYRTLKNVASEFNKKYLKQQDSGSGYNQEAPDDVEDLGDELGDALAARNMAIKVRALIDSLSPQQREVVLLRVFEEFSVQQTAKILGCREGTVKANLHKAMNNLRLASGDLKAVQD